MRLQKERQSADGEKDNKQKQIPQKSQNELQKKKLIDNTTKCDRSTEKMREIERD